jgi:SAM-dependent methyltransferase
VAAGHGAGGAPTRLRRPGRGDRLRGRSGRRAAGAAYPLASLDAVGADPDAARAAGDALRRAGASARCEVEVGGTEVLAPDAYDLVCFLHGLAELADPVGAARAALRSLRPSGALMVVEHTRSDSFFDGPVTIGAWLLRAGAARTRLAASTPHGFVLDARPTH